MVDKTIIAHLLIRKSLLGFEELQCVCHLGRHWAKEAMLSILLKAADAVEHAEVTEIEVANSGGDDDDDGDAWSGEDSEDEEEEEEEEDGAEEEEDEEEEQQQQKPVEHVDCAYLLYHVKRALAFRRILTHHDERIVAPAIRLLSYQRNYTIGFYEIDIGVQDYWNEEATWRPFAASMIGLLAQIGQRGDERVVAIVLDVLREKFAIGADGDIDDQHIDERLDCTMGAFELLARLASPGDQRVRETVLMLLTRLDDFCLRRDACQVQALGSKMLDVLRLAERGDEQALAALLRLLEDFAWEWDGRSLTWAFEKIVELRLAGRGDKQVFAALLGLVKRGGIISAPTFQLYVDNLCVGNQQVQLLTVAIESNYLLLPELMIQIMVDQSELAKQQFLTATIQILNRDLEKNMVLQGLFGLMITMIDQSESAKPFVKQALCGLEMCGHGCGHGCPFIDFCKPTRDRCDWCKHNRRDEFCRSYMSWKERRWYESNGALNFQGSLDDALCSLVLTTCLVHPDLRVVLESAKLLKRLVSKGDRLLWTRAKATLMELNDPDHSYKTKLRLFWEDKGAKGKGKGANGMPGSFETKAGIVAALEDILQVVEGEQSISS